MLIWNTFLLYFGMFNSVSCFRKAWLTFFKCISEMQCKSITFFSLQFQYLFFIWILILLHRMIPSLPGTHTKIIILNIIETTYKNVKYISLNASQVVSFPGIPHLEYIQKVPHHFFFPYRQTVSLLLTRPPLIKLSQQKLFEQQRAGEVKRSCRGYSLSWREKTDTEMKNSIQMLVAVPPDPVNCHRTWSENVD